MLRALVAKALSYRVLVIALALVTAALGAFAFLNLPVDAYPNIAPTQVKMILKAPGMTPEEVESRVITPIEMEMLGIPNQAILRSTAKYAIADITIDFNEGVDIYWARQQVAERLAGVMGDLPASVTGGMAPISTPLSDVYMFTIEGPLSLQQKRELLDWTIRPALRTVPGVADVNALGGYVRTFEVRPDPVALANAKLSVADLRAAIETGNRNDGAGRLAKGEEALIVRAVGAIRGVEDLQSVVVASRDNRIVRLGDVAAVGTGSLTRYGAVTRGGESEAVEGLVIALRGADARQVVDGVRARLAELERALPAGVHINVFYDRSDLIERAVGTVEEALLEATVLVVILLMLFLGDWRAAAIVAATLPMAALITFLFMRGMGLSANLMSLGGLAIAIGMLVDGAVVVVENVVERLAHADEGDTHRLNIVFRATGEVVVPVSAGILIIALVFLPLLSLQGLEGKLFAPVALTIVFALVGSLLLAVTLVPVLASFGLKPGRHGEPWFMRQITPRYRALLDGAFAHRKVVYALSGLGLVVAGLAYTAVGKTFMPTMDEGSVIVQLTKLPSINLEQSVAGDLAAIGLLPPAITPPNGDARRPRIVPYTFAFTDDVERDDLAWQQRLLLLLLSLLLVPPCLNIAILIYARPVTRQEEFAARFALGASRARIVTQLCVEMFVLTSAAGLLALLLTRPILTQLGEIVRNFPGLGGALPFWIDFQFSWRSVLFVAGLTVLAALLAGLAPALQATGRVMPAALRSMNSRTSIPLGATWTALVVAQVGLALAGLPSAVELAWGHLRPAVLGPGFAAREFLTAHLSADPQNLQPNLLRQLASEPGITAVASSSALPGAEPTVLIEADSETALRPSRHYARANHVDPQFFTLFALQPLSGRTLDNRDFHSPGSLVIDQTFARQLFPHANAIGRRIRPAPAPGAEPGPWFEIVGIIPDRPANTSQGRVYLPAIATATPYLALRTGADSAVLSRRLHQIAATLHPALRLDEVRRLDDVLNEIQMTSNLTSYALAIVTLSVLLLSAAGLYALMSFTVARQRRQIAIRMALGAPPARMLAAIFARALSQLAVGAALGVAIALFLHRKLNIEIEGGSPIPGILPAATGFILLIGLLSAAGPARRAIRSDPTEALRNG